MKKLSIKLITGLTILFVIVASIFIIANNRNIKNNIFKTDIEEIIALMNISDSIVFAGDNREELVVKSLEDANKKEIKLENKEVAINEANNIKEEKIDIISDEKKLEGVNKNQNKDINNNESEFKTTQKKRQIFTLNRDQSIKKKEETDVSSKDLNEYVLDIVATYSLEEGAYPYLLNNDFKNYNGVTEDIYYKGELILKANPSGDKASNCTGISFEVFFKAMQKRNKDLGIPVDDFNGMTKDEMFDMALTWFVAKGPKSESNLAVALEKYGLGTRINNLEEVKPGDFIDFSRENNSGHAVVFIDWIRENNQIIGLKLWSSQGSTRGISYKEEYFNIKDKNGNKYGGVIKDSLHIVRVNPVSEYK